MAPPRQQAWGPILAAAVAVAAVATLAIWLWTRSDPDASGRGGDRVAEAGRAGVTEEIDSLRSVVELEIEKRARLEAEVALLRAALVDLIDEQVPGGRDGPGTLDGGSVGAGPGAEKDAAPGPGGAGAPGAVAARGPGATPSFDLDALLAAGVRPGDARALQDRWTQLEMDKLYLADEARRGGWAGTSRFRRSRRDLTETLRSELDEDGWDQFLYATGQPNRVAVGQVLEASPGQRAGLQPGDRIVRYAGQTIYSSRELLRATSEGVAGESVDVLVERDGATTTVRVERGPIGVILKPVRDVPHGG